MSSTRRDDIYAAIARYDWELDPEYVNGLADAVEAALVAREDAEDFAIELDSIFECGCSDDQWRAVLRVLRGDETT